MTGVSLSVQDRADLGLLACAYRALTRNLGHSRGLRVPFHARARACACVLGGAMYLCSGAKKIAAPTTRGYADKGCALPHIPTGSTTTGEIKIKDPAPRTPERNF
jgi:hypothetical protein